MSRHHQRPSKILLFISWGRRSSVVKTDERNFFLSKSIDLEKGETCLIRDVPPFSSSSSSKRVKIVSLLSEKGRRTINKRRWKIVGVQVKWSKREGRNFRSRVSWWWCYCWFNNKNNLSFPSCWPYWEARKWHGNFCVDAPPHLLGMARGDGSQDLPPLSSDTHTEKKSRVTTQGSNYTFNYKNGRRLKCPSFHRVKSFFPHFPECMSSHVFYSLFFTSQRERTSYRSTSSTGTIREVSLPPSLSNNG